MKYFLALIISFCLLGPEASAQFISKVKTIDWSKLPDDYLLGLSVTAEYGNDYILFITGDEIYYYPRNEGAKAKAAIRFSDLKGMPPGLKKVTAAMSWADGKTLLFSGKLGITIDENMQAAELGEWQNLPSGFNEITAACNLNSNNIWLFNGINYVNYSKLTDRTSAVKSLNEIKGWPANWDNITASVNGGDGRIYFFYSNQVLPYDIASNTFVEGFPKVVRAIDQGNNSPFNNSKSKGPANNNNAGTDNAPFKPQQVKEKKYRDDYLPNEEINGRSESGRSIVSSTWLGKGFDIAYVDPLDLSESDQSKRSPIELVFSKQASSDGKYILHYGTEFGEDARTASDVEVVSNLNSEKLRTACAKKISIQVEASVDAPVAGGSVAFSASKSFEDAYENSKTAERMYLIGRKDRVSQHYSLKLDWLPGTLENTIHVNKGVRFIQKLNADFRDEVDHLPTDGNLDAYQSLIQKWGTHFSSRVSFGGFCKSTTTFTRQEFQSSNQSKEEFEASGKASMTAGFKGVGVSGGIGGSYDKKTEKENATGSESSATKTSFNCVGGNTNGSDPGWAKSVDDRPAPLYIEFKPLFVLLTGTFFEDDPNIKAKHDLLMAAMKKYFDRIHLQYPPFDAESIFFDKNGKTTSDKEKQQADEAAVIAKNDKQNAANAGQPEAEKEKAAQEKQRKINAFLNAPTYNLKPNSYYKIRASNGKYLALSDYGQLVLTTDRPGDYKAYWAFFTSKNDVNADPKWVLIKSAYTGQFITMMNGKTNNIYKGDQYGILGLKLDVIGYIDCQSFRLINSGGSGKVEICPNLQDADNMYSTAVDAGGTTSIVLLRTESNSATQKWEIIPVAERGTKDMNAEYQKNLGIISSYFREHPMGNLAWDQAAGEPYNPNPVPASWLQSSNTTAKTETDYYPTTDAEKAAIANRQRLADERKKQEDAARLARQEEERKQKEKEEFDKATKNIDKAKDIIAEALDKRNTAIVVSPAGTASSGWPDGFSKEGVVVYMGENFTGDNDQFTKNIKFISFKKNIRRWYKSVGSLKVAPGWVAYAYSGDDFNGPRLEIRGDWTVSQNPDWKYKITAIAVFHD